MLLTGEGEGDIKERIKSCQKSRIRKQRSTSWVGWVWLASETFSVSLHFGSHFVLFCFGGMFLPFRFWDTGRTNNNNRGTQVPPLEHRFLTHSCFNFLPTSSSSSSSSCMHFLPLPTTLRSFSVLPRCFHASSSWMRNERVKLTFSLFCYIYRTFSFICDCASTLPCLVSSYMHAFLMECFLVIFFFGYCISLYFQLTSS